MKQLLLLLMLPAFCWAQNCPDVKLQKRVSKDITRYETPDSSAIQFVKTVRGQEVVYRMLLRTRGREVTLGLTGVSIDLSNGTTFSRESEPIDVINMDGGWEYSASFTLSPEELESFYKNNILRFKLADRTRELTPMEQEKFRTYAACISGK